MTPDGEGVLPGASCSRRDPALNAGDLYWPAWSRLLAAAQEGGAPAFDPPAHGQPVFGWLGEHPGAGDHFKRLMVAATTETAAPVVAYDFSPFARIVDVGGGYGAPLSAVLRAVPSAHGVLFDLLGLADQDRLDSSPRASATAAPSSAAISSRRYRPAGTPIWSQRVA